MKKLLPVLSSVMLFIALTTQSRAQIQIPSPSKLLGPIKFYTDLNYPVNNGIIQGDFSITFVDNGKTINPNQKFKLSDLGLVAGNRSIKKPDGYHDRGLKAYKEELNSPRNHTAHSFYKIKINRENDTTTYYGIIGFYNTTEGHKDDAVARYYEIRLSDKLFEQSLGGNLSYNYEFWKSGLSVVPTWIILFSDSKELMWRR